MPGFSDRLRSLRVNFGLSQQKLADSIGNVSKSSINMYERGEREPSLETMEAFADFFNVDLDFLYGKSDVPNRTQVSGNEKQSPKRAGQIFSARMTTGYPCDPNHRHTFLSFPPGNSFFAPRDLSG